MPGMILQDAVKHDRTVRRKQSRKAYAVTVGITENRVHALEYGRKPKDEELKALAPLIGDLLEEGIIDATLDPSATPSEEQPDPVESEVHAERMTIGTWYLAIMNQLQSRVPPQMWPSQFRMETVPPVEFPAIKEYLAGVSQWLLEQDGYAPPSPVDDVEASPPVGESDDYTDSEDEERWETTYDSSQNTTIPPAPDLTQGQTVPPPTDGQFTFDPALVYVTNGELQTFQDCQRRWYLESYRELGLPVRKVTGAAAVGTRFHDSVAVWYQPEPGDPWARFNEGVENDREMLEDIGASEELIKDFNSEVDLVRAMLEGYFQWIQEESVDAGLKIIAPEAIISANPQFPEFPNHRLLAKLDVRVEREMDGSRWFIDHKTVQNFMDLIKTAHMDPQMLHYHLIEWLKIVEEGLSQDVRAGGAMHNMARKVKRTATAQPPFYQREEIRHNTEQIQSYWRKVRRVLHQIEEARSRLSRGEHHLDVVPPRPTRDCSWKCEFFAVCPMMDDATARAEDYLSEQFILVNHLARYEPEAAGETM